MNAQRSARVPFVLTLLSLLSGLFATIPAAQAATPRDLHISTACRVYDSRQVGGPTGTPLASGDVRNVDIPLACAIPDDAVAVIVTLTVIFPPSDGYIQVYKGGGPVPTANALAFQAGELLSQFFVVEVGPGPDLQVRPFLAGGGATHFAVDVFAFNGSGAPNLVELDNTTVFESQPAGTLVGNLSTADPDLGDTHTYSLVTGTGDADNTKFAIVGSELRTAVVLDREGQNPDGDFLVRVRSADNFGVFLDVPFTVIGANVNDAPAGTDNAVSTPENTDYTFAAADFGFTDPGDSPANAFLAVTITTLPALGTLELSNVAVTAGQSIPVASIPNLTFTPVTNANGSPYTTFTFQVQDDGGTANSGVDLDPSANTMTVNVTSVNSAPAGTNGTVVAPEDGSYSFVAADFGFTDPNDTPANAFLAVTITTLPAAGSLTLSSNPVTAGQSVPVASIPNLTFTPAANANGSPYTTFTFQVQDNGGTAGGGVDLDPSANTMTVNVTAINDAPTVTTTGGTTAFTEDGGAVVVDSGVTVADIDSANLTSATVTITNPQDGTSEVLAGTSCAGLTVTPGLNSLSITGSQPVATYQTCLQSVTYDNTSQNPTAAPARTLSFVANDGSNPSTAANKTVSVAAADDGPVAVADAATVGEDSGATAVDVLANDTDVDAGTKLVASVTQPTNGTVVITGGGTGVTYAPNANYCNNPPGTMLDTFTYTLTPGGSSTTVTMTVTCIDDSPLAVADAATVNEDSGANAVNVLANDTDVDAGTKLVVSVTQPANGTVVITGGGTGVTYAPNANYCNNPPGTTLDTFTYTLTPGGSSATVTMTVTCLNDGPALDLDADDSGGTTGADYAITFTEGDAAKLLEDPLDATVTDIDSTTLASLTVTLTNLFDTGFETLSVDVTGTSITATYVTTPGAPGTGTLTLTGPDTLANFQTVLRKVRYVNTDTAPDATARVINFVANDGSTNSNTAVSTVTVVPVDSPPVAVADAATVNEDSGATAIDVLANDTDADGGTKLVASVTQPANGTVVITGGGTGLTYAPNPNYCNNPPGTTLDTFNYTLTPGSSSTTVTVTVTCVDDNPVAVADAATVTEDSGANAVDVLANDTDADGGTKLVASVTQPANGTVVITGGGTGLTYAPNANYCNTPPGTTLDTFTYTLTPGGSSTTVTVTVTCVDDNPVAVADAATVSEDSGATAVDVLANDTDVDGGTKLVTSVTQPTNGAVVITGGGTGLTYAPNANYCNNPPGTTLDTFTYTLTPGGSSTTVTVTVTCVDDPPVAVADAATVTEDSGANAVNVLANDTDIDGGTKLVTSVTQPANGSVVITGGGTGLTYAPNANYCNNPPGTALDTFTYTLTPGGSSTTVTMTVTCVNDPPVADNDTFDFVGNTELVIDLAALATPHVLETTGTTFGVLDGDSDPVEGDNIAVSAITVGACTDLSAPLDCNDPAVGRVQMQANGRFLFTPAAGDTGATETFSYTVTDDGVPAPASTTATVTLTRFERVWYVDGDAPGGGTGLASAPFNTFDSLDGVGGAGDVDLVGDTIFVHAGAAIATSATVPLEGSQRVLGQGAGLSFPVNLNGNGSPTVLVAAEGPITTRPTVSRATGDLFTMVNDVAAEIRALTLSAPGGNVVELSSTGALTGSSTLAISDNVVSGAGAEGLNLNLGVGTTGTLGLTIANNSWNTAGTHTGTAINVVRTAGTLNANISSNANVLSAGTAINVSGALTLTGFANNTVHQNTGGIGININGATFDVTPGGTFQTVSGGTTVVGAPGNGVGTSGVVLTSVAGDLSFTDLDVFADGGAGLRASGTAAYTGSAGFQVAVGAGVSIIAATGGPAVDLATVTANLPFQTITSTNSTTTGVALANVADGGGTNSAFSAGSGSSITTAAGASGPAFSVSGGNAAITYPGTITNNSTSARAVSIASWAGDDAGDDLLLSGAIDENGAGILVNGNGGSRSITFSGGMDIDTTTGEGFAATSNTNTGGLHITGTNTIDSVSAAALRVTSTTIGSSNLTFRSISSGNNTAAADPANGIVLSNTGSSGGLVVTGNGGACTEGSSTCTGGWIQNMTGGDDSSATPAGTGIVLNNTANVSLTRMRINDTSNYGIRGTSVSGFTFTNGVVDGANGTNVSTPFNEGSLLFFGVTGTSSGMTGTGSITNSTIMGGRQRNIAIDNSVGTLNLTVSGNTIKRTSDAAGDDGFFLEADTTANVTLALTNNTFARHGGDHVNVTMLNNAVVDLTITGNTLHGNYTGTPEGNHPIGLTQGIFVFGATFNGTCTYEISNNGSVGVPFRGNRQGGAINVNKGSGTGTFSGTIENNVIGDPAVTGSGSTEAFGIIVGSRGSGAHTTLINNNLIRQYFDRGIVLEAGEGSAALNATVTNNSISNFADAVNSLHGIHSDNGILAGDTNPVCLQISGNSVATAGNEPAGGADIRLRRGSSTTVNLPGVAGATNANATTLLQANNPTATTITVTGNGFSSGAACPLP